MNIRKRYEFHAQWDSLVDLHLDQLRVIWVNELEPITRKKEKKVSITLELLQ